MITKRSKDMNGYYYSTICLGKFKMVPQGDLLLNISLESKHPRYILEKIGQSIDDIYFESDRDDESDSDDEAASD